MPVKFKLGFTIDGETLFGILSKFLPVSDVTVEEIVEPPRQTIGELVHALHPKRVKQVRRKKGNGYALQLHAGMNAIIMATMADGAEHVGADCFPALKAAGYSTNGLYGKLNRLKHHGLLTTPHKGKWKVTPLGKERWEAPPDPQLPLEKAS